MYTVSQSRHPWMLSVIILVYRFGAMISVTHTHTPTHTHIYGTFERYIKDVPNSIISCALPFDFAQLNFSGWKMLTDFAFIAISIWMFLLCIFLFAWCVSICRGIMRSLHTMSPHIFLLYSLFSNQYKYSIHCTLYTVSVVRSANKYKSKVYVIVFSVNDIERS